ncbi:MAG TPA: hypothetical protein PKA27_07440 [Fimbriimonadaceae bacterium]|nr:hypothetical protein [Fimbriimonadaceae bacterium]
MNSGYSGTPLDKKLGLKPGSRLWIRGERDLLVGLLPRSGFVVLDHPESIEVAVLFCLTHDDLMTAWGEAVDQVVDRGGMWIAWPKKASKVPTELTEDTLREVLLPLGWVDNKVCAISDVWSGLRFVRRLTPPHHR